MIYFANPSGGRVQLAMLAGRVGYIDTPAQGNRRHSLVTWCADNGCFGKGYPGDKRWLGWLAKHHRDAPRCKFATAPDVVGDADATLVRSTPFLATVRTLGYPVAFVAQNGATPDNLPWADFDCLFIGGCVECPEHGPRLDAIKTGTGCHQKFFCEVCKVQIFEWKLGPEPIVLAAEAKTRGKWVHMGRVNSRKRMLYADSIGCDSVDGTYLTRGSRINLPKLLSWLDDVPAKTP